MGKKVVLRGVSLEEGVDAVANRLREIDRERATERQQVVANAERNRDFASALAQEITSNKGSRRA